MIGLPLRLWAWKRGWRVSGRDKDGFSPLLPTAPWEGQLSLSYHILRMAATFWGKPSCDHAPGGHSCSGQQNTSRRPSSGQPLTLRVPSTSALGPRCSLAV